ncbi:MAG: hypothetical protein HeimC2_34130 [Candidatus Heimdallarchaeota archaeon LC_2]|nr:MAG: hypothetical protein HeimC2_34130 [Candidatus Heimdallarchaeota archaeon LC_2]
MYYHLKRELHPILIDKMRSRDPSFKFNSWAVNDIIKTPTKFNPFRARFEYFERGENQSNVQKHLDFVNKREIVLEQIRIERFPEKPSRFRCFWLTHNTSDLKRWKSKILNSSDSYELFEVVPLSNTKVHFANSKYITENELSSKETLHALARKYWSVFHNTITTPFLSEVLIEGRIRIKRKIDHL